MLLDILFVVVGAAMVLFGADRLTDGAVAIARRFGLPEIVIGLTIVALGTSLPEFIVSLVSAINGSGDMSIGNIVGSNIFNTMLIVGATAIVLPISVAPSTVSKDIPFMLLASVAVPALALDALISDGSTNMLDRGDGIALLGFMAVFITYTLAMAKRDKQPVEATAGTALLIPLWRAMLYIVFGLAGLILGGEAFVDGATGIARSLGVSDAVIGLTLVAGGTSLPELATSIVAARKGQSDIAIGNVIGSNMFNAFGILGACSLFTPLAVGGVSWVDFAMLAIGTALFWLFARTQLKVLRWEGGVLVAVFLIYMSWLVIR